MPLFVIPIIVGLITQLFKIIFDTIEEKNFKLEFLRRWWWFPSVHSSISSSITTLMYLNYWINSPLFALSLIFSFLFWYDAMNVRYEAWKHALYIKNLIENFKDSFKKKPIGLKNIDLKDRLGHTFFEVISWIIIWFSLTIIIYKLWF